MIHNDTTTQDTEEEVCDEEDTICDTVESEECYTKYEDECETVYKERCSTEYELECTTGEYQLHSVFISTFLLSLPWLHHIVLFTEYVETCQPTYGGNVLLATYSEG